MGFFNWLTDGVRRAIVRGVEQAAAQINETQGDAKITICLPAFTDPLRIPQDEPTNGKRKVVRA